MSQVVRADSSLLSPSLFCVVHVRQTVTLGGGGREVGRSVYGSLGWLKMNSQILKIFFLGTIRFFLVLKLTFDQG